MADNELQCCGIRREREARGTQGRLFREMGKHIWVSAEHVQRLSDARGRERGNQETVLPVNHPTAGVRGDQNGHT
jgi:hypothetical protein